MNITCGECGYSYNHSLSCCPECGNPTVVTEPFINHTGLSNCPNCGAPVSNNFACDYCESRFPKVANPNLDAAERKGHNNEVREIRKESRNSGVKAGAAAAAFLGGLLGGIIGD